ncbi:MAG: hypothetical protein VX672_06880, partial [Planctomycetota bacterium]|nr:hypothetical protein [Planctomycetota bacterium]
MEIIKRITWMVAALAVITGPAADAFGQGGPIPVEVVQTKQGWRLLRGGEPYVVRGAGWGTPIESVKAAGGNTIRTWGIGSNTGQLLDAAHERGMTVLIGLWMQHVGDGFDYTDLAAVEAQQNALVAQAAQFKDHPALLGWGVGNEVEMFNDSGAVWRAIGGLASALKELDPNHPTVAVTAEIGVAHEQRLSLYCPDIDIWGINAYGSLPSLPSRLTARGYEGPYLVTEYGDRGPWEVGKTSWNAPFEPSSTQKAENYLAGWREVIQADATRCLGGFPFIWKPAADPADTWFPMLTWDGRPLGVVQAMQEAWTGSAPADLSPRLGSIDVSDERLEARASFTATVSASDPEGEAVTHEWFLARDLIDGSGTWTGSSATVICLEESGSMLAATAPYESGPWRLFVVASDPAGNAAMASRPLYVDGLDDGFEASPTFAVDDHFIPTGWMGDTSALSLNRCNAPNPDCGGRCHRLVWTPTGVNWFGMLWQHPPDNWGGSPGLPIAPGADRVRFTAWSDTGFNATFRVGGS